MLSQAEPLGPECAFQRINASGLCQLLSEAVFAQALQGYLFVYVCLNAMPHLCAGAFAHLSLASVQRSVRLQA